MPEPMSAVGVDIIIATEPVSECTVQLLMTLSSNFHKNLKNRLRIDV